MPVAMETITVQSHAFRDGDKIARKHSMEGQNVSPDLEWSGVPAEAKELIVMMEDPDGLAGNFSHWLVYNISPDTGQLPEGIEPVPQPSMPKGIMQGKNSFARIGYGGPLPGPGSGVHHYFFRVFVLDRTLGLAPGLDKEDIQNAMRGHVIARGHLMGTYER